ncbi:reverse transcriptase N-terminal domain-containing protein [Streptomyces sp. NPDC088183]|uniref:reverse transcriptase N-terminal domain-containing protein n=1 Tax=Streptomyces sp. NPDC088183 TaxID=3160992 RepID=UPI00344AAC93
MTSQPLPYHGGRLPAGQGLGQFRGVGGPVGADGVGEEGERHRLGRVRGRRTAPETEVFEATQAGDLKKVRNPQKLMLRSRSSTLVGVKRVSGGRETAGIGGRRAAGRGSGGGVRPHRP